MSDKCLDKCFIIYKIILYRLTQIVIIDLLHISDQFFKHTVCAFLGCRHVVCCHILIFIRLTDLTDIELQIVIITDHIAKYFDKIHLIIVCDSIRIRIPDLSVQCSCLILQDQIVIWLPVSCLCASFSFAQINISDGFAFY